MDSTECGRGISGCSTVAVVKDQISADLADEAVILHLESGVYYGLDGVGARIWALIQEPKVVNDVRDTLLDEYDVDPERCESELLAFLEELAAQALIEVQSAPGA